MKNMNLEDSISNETGTYRVECVGAKFIVIDPSGEQVGTYPTEDAANEDVKRCRREDRMWESAKMLYDFAIKAHMQMHEVDRETSVYWLHSVSEVVD